MKRVIKANSSLPDKRYVGWANFVTNIAESEGWSEDQSEVADMISSGSAAIEKEYGDPDSVIVYFDSTWDDPVVRINDELYYISYNGRGGYSCYSISAEDAYALGLLQLID